MNDNSMNKPLESDWDRVEAMTDDEIDTSDIPPLTEDFFRRARVRMPKKEVTVAIDADLINWFEAQDDDIARRINAALRIYVEAHRAA